MKKSYSLRFVIFVAVFSILSSLAVTMFFFAKVVIPKREKMMYDYNAKILEIKALVDEYYIGEIDHELMTHYLAYGYVGGLNDRYAGYVTPKDAEESMNSLFGYNTGMGVQVAQHPDTLNIYISEVHAGSPADKAGILPGDEILQIDDKVVKDFGYKNTLSYIKTVPNGNKLTAVVKRGDTELELEMVLTQYVAQSVFHKKVDDKGYILITEFNDMTVDQFVNAVDDLMNLGVSSLVFDLRGNGGGTLQSVVHMVDYLVPEGLIIKVDYKDDKNDEEYLSDKHEIDVPMVILTDENTASASEIFTQSLIDYGKAVSVGRKTYGKGVVQSTFELSDGSLVRFTVAKYYTANGTCLDGIGITPEFPVEWTDEELKYRLVTDISDDKDYIKACQYLDGQLS